MNASYPKIVKSRVEIDFQRPVTLAVLSTQICMADCGRNSGNVKSVTNISTPCPQKTCDYIFYNNFKNKCRITIIFGIVSSKSMCHQKMVSFPTSPI